MLAPDVEIAGLDGRHITGWLSLLAPPGADPGLLVIVLEGGGAVAAAVTGRGPVEVVWNGDPRATLRTLRREHGVGGAIAIEREAIADIMGDGERALRFGDDYAAQVLTLWRALKGRAGEGVWLDPPLLDIVPSLRAEPLQTTFDLLIPDGSSVVAYVFEDDGSAAACSVIARKHGGQVTHLGCHRALEDRLSEAELARDWRTRIPRLLDVVNERFAPPSVGVFADRAAVARVIAGPADQLGRELRSGNIVLSPAPAWLLGLVGGAAVAGLASRGARSVARFLPPGARVAAASVARGAQDRVKASGINPFAALGFDPIELLAELRLLYR